jgi:hypothetical protein
LPVKSSVKKVKREAPPFFSSSSFITATSSTSAYFQLLFHQK